MREQGMQVDGYDGELLRLAEDLGHRLLPAFDTPTGIPYGSINLKHGVAHDETTVRPSHPPPPPPPPAAAAAAAAIASVLYTLE
eukprot:jgi/Mesen1/497/ME000104S10588